MADQLYACALRALRDGLGDESAEFRDDQFDAISDLVQDRSRLLLVKRTGWGKSVVYFVGTKLLRDQGAGPTLIVSPLLSLMRNQLAAARRFGLRIEKIDSDNRDDWERIYSLLDHNEVDVLLIAPERLANGDFIARAGEALFARLGFLVVDEAHCISDWGHAFRPDYQRISQFIRFLPPNVPLLATTATADAKVSEDVRVQLGGEVRIVRGSLGRDSLHLDVIAGLEYSERLAWLAQAIPLLPGSGIVYVLTQRDAEVVTGWLLSRAINALAYHKDVPDREQREDALLNNAIKVLVATTALGMGYDKADLGFVIHFQSTQSIIHYYQMVGRAGRAIDDAFCILLTGDEDDEIIESFSRNEYPSQDLVEKILRALEAEAQSTYQLFASINAPQGKIQHAIRILSAESPSPIIDIDGAWSRTAEPYEYPVGRVAALAQRRYADRAAMTAYGRVEGCLMQILGRHLGDEMIAPCGRCGVCVGSELLIVGDLEEVTAAAEDFVVRREIALPIKKRWPPGGLPSYGFVSNTNIRSELRAEAGRSLALLKVGRVGRRIQPEKYRDDRFSDVTLAEAADLIREWNPQPSPQWIVPMISTNFPNLVPEFADRLGNELGIPVHRALRKIRDTEEQKGMENSSHQASNIDGSLEVISFQGMEKPGLFVDDVYNSGWTATVVIALLRRAGAGVIFPFTLLKARPGD